MRSAGTACIQLRLARLIREGVEPLPPEISLEVFPKQARVKGDGLGNLIKIPLGVHRKTGRRCHFLNPDGSPVADQLACLAGLRTVPFEHVLDLLSRRGPETAGLPEQGEDGEDRDLEEASAAGLPGGGRDRTTRARAGDEPFAVTEAAGPVSLAPYDRNKDLEYLWLLRRCPLLAQVVRKAEAAQALTMDERMVVVHTMGHIASGPEAVNAPAPRGLRRLDSDRDVAHEVLASDQWSEGLVDRRVAGLVARRGPLARVDPVPAAEPRTQMHGVGIGNLGWRRGGRFDRFVRNGRSTGRFTDFESRKIQLGLLIVRFSGSSRRAWLYSRTARGSSPASSASVANER